MKTWIYYLTLVLSSPAVIFAKETMDSLVPPRSTKIATNRYISSLSYEDSKKHFAQRFLNNKSASWPEEEIILPHVQAHYLAISDKLMPFSGINIYYRTKDNLTEIFFLPR